MIGARNATKTIPHHATNITHEIFLGGKVKMQKPPLSGDGKQGGGGRAQVLMVQAL